MAENDTPVPPRDEPPTRTLPTAGGSPGVRINGYRLLQKVGEGGMGEVWEAEQEEPVRRRVALKLIKAGMDTEQVIARFESERQALALMNHPFIARVFDAGATGQGRPYFAMEYVAGLPISEYCDRQRLRTPERLQLFMQACEGVQHAHHKGIIHRDLKPSNILVAEQDRKAVPKIIDFGVAKATDRHLTERTVYTQLGQWIGTPEYMSPEQAELSGLDIDTRTDVYSLGAVLYELLVGARVFDSDELQKASFDEVRRRIREQDPPKPSTRITSLGDTSTTIASKRRTEPATLSRHLRGDLDWIVMKALDKDRARRYGSPMELAQDIGRHLRHEPVLASPPGILYRARKFVRRHRVGVAFSAALAVVLIASFIGLALQARRIARERDRANAEARTASEVVEFLLSSFRVADPEHVRHGEVTAREILDQGATRIRQELGGDPGVRARLMATMGSAYLGLAYNEEAEPLLEEALRLQEERLGPQHPDLVPTLHDLADALDRRGEESEAVAFHERALKIREGAMGPDDPAVADSLVRLSRTSSFAAAEEHLRRAVRILEEQTPPLPIERAQALHVLGFRYFSAGRLDDSEGVLEEAVSILEAARGSDAVELVDPLTNLAGVLEYQGRREEGLALDRRAVSIAERVRGAEHPWTAAVLNNLAVRLHFMGEYTEAESYYRRVLTVAEETLGPNSGLRTTALINLGELYRDQGQFERAEEMFEQALPVVETYGEESPRLAYLLGQWGLLHFMAGRSEEAERLFARFVELAERHRLLSDPEFAPGVTAYGELLRQSGRISEADSILERMEAEP